MTPNPWNAALLLKGRAGRGPCKLFQHSRNASKSALRLPLFSSVFEPRFQEKVAFTDFRGDHYTFAQLGAKAASLSEQISCRLKNGEDSPRVAFLTDRNLAFPTTLVATWMTRSVAIPLSSSHPDSMLEYFLQSTGSRLLLCSETYKDKLHGVAKKTGVELCVVDFDKLADGDVNLGVKAVKEHDYEGKGGLILFTSGTTGQPKGVLLTHSNLLDQVTNICDAWEITEKDTMLHVLPLHHTHGLIHALISPLAVGARSHMLQKFDAAKAWAELLSTNAMRPNVLMGVPTVWIKLVEEFDKSFAKSSTKVSFIKETLKQKMRLMLSGSASLPVPVLERFEQISGHRLLERYGMTEIGMALTNPLHGERKPGFVGKPFESVKLQIVDMKSRDSYKVLAESDSKGTRSFVPKGEKVIGDLLVKGPSVFQEYWGNPDATKKEFTDDGWFITGDTVEFTDNAYKILGRKSVDIIKSGGYKLSALEIETQLLSFPEIKEIAVMGLPDPTWGQRVAAVLTWSGKELSLDEFKELAKKRVAPYAIPTVLKALPELPRNHLGKVNKKELVKIFSS